MSASYVDVERVSYPIASFRGLDVVSPEDTTRLGVAHNAYNVDFMGRTLVPGYGSVGLAIGAGEHIRDTLEDLKPERIFRWQVYDRDTGEADDRLVVWRSRKELDNAGAIYYIRLADGLVVDTTFRVLDEITSTLNYKFNGKYGFFIFEKSGLAKGIYQDATIIDMTLASFSDTLFACGKFFAIMQWTDARIFYHTNTNPGNWHEDYGEYGYIDLENDGKGVLRKLLQLKDTVYAFSDYGITRLTMYTDRQQIKATSVLNFRGKLLPQTPVVAGGVIVFATTAGVYTFDGFALTKIYAYVTPLLLVEEGEPIAYYYQDKYYLAGRIERAGDYMGDEVGTGYVNNAVFVLDLVNDRATISRGFDVRSFYEIDYEGERHLMIEPYTKNIGKLCEFVKESGKNLNMSLRKYWEMPFTDFCENTKLKCIRRIIITTLSDLTVTVKVDEKTTTYDLVGSDKPQTIVVNQTGDRFSIALSTSRYDYKIGNMTVELDLIRRYNGHQ